MKKIIFYLFFIVCFSLFGQEEVETKILFTHENDLFGFINNNDENYTGGFSLELQFPEIDFIQPFFKLYNSKNIQRISLAGAGYTPQNLETNKPVIGDRPYASFAYLGYGLISINKYGTVLSSELNIGFMGLSGPGKVQSWIHDSKFFKLITDRPVPEGWHNQIANGGALMINYNFKYSTKFNNHLSDIEINENINKKIKYFDTALQLGLDLGNYMTNLNLGLYIDVFNLNNNTSLEYDSSSTIQKNIIKEKSKFKSVVLNPTRDNSKKFKMNLFFKPNIRFAIHNSTLEGLLFNDNSIYKIPSEEVKRILFEFSTGVNLNFKKRWLLRYSMSARSREFKGGKSMHYWGGVTIGYEFN